jgi:hypothetical protein
MQSKIYGVKSNAARAAKSYGLKRDDLIAVSGGWLFNIPNETAPQSSTEPATEAVDETLTTSEPAVQADEPIEWGGYDYMVVNGEKPVAAVHPVPGETYIFTVEPNGVVSSVAPAKPASLSASASRRSISRPKPSPNASPSRATKRPRPARVRT